MCFALTNIKLSLREFFPCDNDASLACICASTHTESEKEGGGEREKAADNCRREELYRENMTQTVHTEICSYTSQTKGPGEGRLDEDQEDRK